MAEGDKKPLILVTNDDGVEANGLKALIDSVRPFGNVVVVAPAEPQSGMSHAITVKVPLRISKTVHEPDFTVYKCYGTPVDCVKMAMNNILPDKPDLLVSGINHGSNASTSVFYSGTMAAVLEGCINEIPAIGFSLLNFDHNADFSQAGQISQSVVSRVLENGLPSNVCLNVNIPDLGTKGIRGIKICRQNKGFWREEFDKRTDPLGKHYYWLTGYFHNTEPEATDTDEWALNNGYVSIVPLQTDLTSYTTINTLNNWNFGSKK